ncbi:RodZ domain-containing protein [Spiribacter pallidus]|uniref:RodZ domain-containing protein n=1 Tax=Spiribacter pallidus TaxID=1987936 RepID=A0ABV3TEZ4_9GAMM
MGEQDKTLDRNAAAMSGPGVSLRDERLRRQLSVEQIAQALHLDQATITRLEADDYSALPPLTFVRGYLRAYAQWIELDADDLVRRLDAMGLAEDSAPLRAHAGMTGTSTRRPRPAGRTPGVVVLAALLIAGLGVVGAGAWYLTDRGLAVPWLSDMTEGVDNAQRGEPSDAGENTATTTQANRPPEASDAEASSDEAPAPIESSESIETAEPIEALESTDSSEPTESSEPTNADATVDESPGPLETPAAAPSQDGEAMASTGDAAGTASNADTAGTASSAAATAESAPTPEVAAGTAEQQAIELTYTGDSWMEIRDDRGERLLFGMARPGTARVAGKPPFDVVVGNTDHVTLRYQGEVVNLEAYARQKVARFTLGSDE